MTNEWVIALTPFVFVVLGVIGYFWMRRESQKLDREFGPDRPAGE